MAVYSSRFSELIKCDRSRKYVAGRLKLPLNFIIEQDKVRIDTVSKHDSGAFAKVVHAKYLGADVRIKRIHAILTEHNRLDVHRFLQECRLASDLRHPNVVQYYGVVMDGFLPMLVMEELVCNLYEFIDHPEKFAKVDDVYDTVPNLTDVSENLSYNEANGHDNECSPKPKPKPKPQQKIKKCHKINIALGIAQGLDYLHTKKPYPIVHRDLSSGNILLGTLSFKFIAKIADFGQSKEIKSEDDWSSHNPGTQQYLPPEVLLLDHQDQQIPFNNKRNQPPQNSAQGDRQQVDDVNQPPHGSAQRNEQLATPDIDQVPEAQEPDEIRVRNETLPANSRRPRLSTSIDMYMYGVLILELSSEQHAGVNIDYKKSWHMNHVRKVERLDKCPILYQIAKRCIKENPSERYSAANVVDSIAQNFTSMDSHPSTQNMVSSLAVFIVRSNWYYLQELADDRRSDAMLDDFLLVSRPECMSRDKSGSKVYILLIHSGTLTCIDPLYNSG